MDERRIHDRIDNLEQVLTDHLESHTSFEKAIAENTVLTKEIAVNTSELVSLVKGIKGFRTFTLWLAPFMVALVATWTWLKAHW